MKKIVALVVFAGIVGGCERLKEFREERIRRAEEAEVVACHGAGYIRPVWAGGVFYCADSAGRLFPVAEPPCSTHNSMCQK